VAVSKAQVERGERPSVICFGTGDGAPCEDRNHASFLYRLGRTTVLVDCGEAMDRSYKASGLSYDAIDAIFLSHLHSDHVGGFFMFMQGMWLEGRRKPLKVYLPGKAIKPLREMLNTVFLFDEVLPFRLELIALEEKKGTKVRDVRVTPFYTTHLDRTRAQFGKKYRADFSAYCFLIENRGVRIGHSADLGRPEDLEPLLAERLDLLVCELSHFRPDEIFSYLREREVKQVAFVHIGRAYREQKVGLRRLGKEILGGVRCVFPVDGEEIRCNRR
jgi:ribonuclease BN (tRNA processing enzyme)